MQSFERRLQSLVRDTVAPTLVKKVREAYDKLTEAEKAELDRAETPWRFPKVLLNAVVDSKMLDREIGSESAAKELRKTRRILKTR